MYMIQLTFTLKLPDRALRSCKECTSNSKEPSLFAKCHSVGPAIFVIYMLAISESRGRRVF